MNYSRIVSSGSYLPERILSNTELEQSVSTSDEWIRARTGIQQRHIAADSENTSDLAESAARAALTSADIDPQSVDLIIVATTTADHIFPSVATEVQYRLGITSGMPAFDIQAVCTGFIYALATADQFVRAGNAQRALVIGAETFSRILNWQDRGTCILFGDGAGAVLIERADEPGIYSSHLHADGRYKELLWVPEGVSTSNQEQYVDRAFVEMRGNEVFKIAVRTLSALVDETLQHNNMTAADLHWLVPHQANERILAATAKKLGMPMNQVINCVAEHANTSAASVPLALDQVIRDGRIQRGHNVLLEAFGGGFTWGSVLLKY